MEPTYIQVQTGNQHIGAPHKNSSLGPIGSKIPIHFIQHTPLQEEVMDTCKLHRYYSRYRADTGLWLTMNHAKGSNWWFMSGVMSACDQVGLIGYQSNLYKNGAWFLLSHLRKDSAAVNCITAGQLQGRLFSLMKQETAVCLSMKDCSHGVAVVAMFCHNKWVVLDSMWVFTLCASWGKSR